MLLQQTEIEGLLPDRMLTAIEKTIERIVEGKVTNAMATFNETIKSIVKKSYAQVLKDGQNYASNNCDRNSSVA